MFATKASAKPIVQRFRFRSTSEPPPNGPPPAPPIPNAPESPASFPEWSRIKKIRITDRKTWTTLKTVSIGRILVELPVPLGGLAWALERV
jgi:hypothetical protein